MLHTPAHKQGSLKAGKQTFNRIPSATKTAFTFVAEASNGVTISEDTVVATTRKAARAIFWDSLSEAGRNACSSIECLDEVAA